MAHHCEAKLFAHNSYLYDFAKNNEQDSTQNYTKSRPNVRFLNLKSLADRKKS